MSLTVEQPDRGRAVATAAKLLAGPWSSWPPEWRYLAAKRAIDVLGALLLLVPLAVVSLALLVLNPFLNRGPLLFSQERLGQDCRVFRAWKLRTMHGNPDGARGAFDALETHRITRLGWVLRRSRLDELPQSLNVLRGEMSLIGPRPDSLAHALTYLQEVPGYGERLRARPGITGLAQVELGYAEGLEAVRAKVAADLRYLAEARLSLDLWIAWRTALVVLFARGA